MTSTAERRIRVLVADDHAIVRDGIIGILERQDDVEVVGAALDGDEAVRMYEELLPDLLLTDQQMPGWSGLELVQRIRASHPDARILIVSAYADEGLVSIAMREGAMGYIHKSLESSRLADAVRRAASGQAVLDDVTTAALVQSTRPHAEEPEELPVLSRREREVLSAVAGGASNAEVGQMLFISPQTVKTHLARAYAKLGVGDRAAAVYQATLRGLLDTAG